MKEYVFRIKQYWKVFSVLIILLVAFWWIDGFNLKDISINIAASMATLVGTIFILDVFTEKNRENQFKIAKSVVKEDISMLTNMLTSHLAAPLGTTIHEVEEEPDLTGDFLSSLKQMLKVVELVEKKGIQDTLEKMTISDWKHFFMNLMLVKNSISENMVLYKDLISPELLGYLLKVRKDFNSIYSLFGLVPELLLKEEKDYPSNKGGLEANRKYRQGLIMGLSGDLIKYFSDLKKLNKCVQQLFND